MRSVEKRAAVCSTTALCSRVEPVADEGVSEAASLVRRSACGLVAAELEGDAVEVLVVGEVGVGWEEEEGWARVGRGWAVRSRVRKSCVRAGVSAL